MLKRLRERLTYANVLSTIALFAALGGGSAYAASLITTSDIADNAVISRKIKDHTVKPADLAAAPTPRRVGTPGNPAFGNGGDGGCVWSNADLVGTTSPASFYKDAYGRVHLSGIVEAAAGSSGDASCDETQDAYIFRLPPGYRPAKVLIFSVAGGDVSFPTTTLLIAGKNGFNNGVTTIPAGTVTSGRGPMVTSLFGLDGVSFRAAG